MRIVTLLPSATEMVAALGLADSIVGISHECDFPRAVTDRPRLTQTTLEAGLSSRDIDDAVAASVLEGRPLYAVDANALAALRPDLIVTQGVCSVCAVTPAQLLGLDRVTDAPVLSLGAVDVAGILQDLRRLAEAAGVVETGAALVERWRAEWDALAAPDPKGPTVLFAEWSDPLWVGGHWVPEMIAAAGGRPLFGKAGAPSGRVSWDDARAARPEVVVFGACGFDLERNVAEAAGVQLEGARAYAIDANAFTSRPAPRVLRGLAILRAMVRGDLSGIATSEARAMP